MLHSDPFYVSILIDFNCNIKCSVFHGWSISVYWLDSPYWVVDIQLHFSSSLFLHCFPCFISCMLPNTFIKYRIKVWFTLLLMPCLSSQEVDTSKFMSALWRDFYYCSILNIESEDIGILFWISLWCLACREKKIMVFQYI